MANILTLVCLCVTATVVAGQNKHGGHGIIMEVSHASEYSLMDKQDEMLRVLTDGLNEWCDMSDNKHSCCDLVGMRYKSMFAPSFSLTTPDMFMIDEFEPTSDNSVKFRLVGKYSVSHLENQCSGYSMISDSEREEYIPRDMLHEVAKNSKISMYATHHIEIVDVYAEDVGCMELCVYRDHRWRCFHWSDDSRLRRRHVLQKTVRSGPDYH